MSLLKRLFGKRETEEQELDSLIDKADPETIAQITQLAALKRMKNIASLYESGGFMKKISVDEQKAHIVMIEFMRGNSVGNSDQDMFKDFLHQLKSVHYKGNSVLGAYLKEVT